MTEKQQEQRLEFCRLVARWYLNTQCTQERPWGAPNSADLGRFLYEYCPSTRQWRGNSVWGQAAGAMALLAMADRLDGVTLRTPLPQHPHNGVLAGPCRDAAIAAGGYLMTLQILDQRNPVFFGAFRQSNPQTMMGNPRDGATGCMGLCTLYKHTRNEEYLYRARLFGDWFIRQAMAREQWPFYTFHYDDRGGEWHEPELFQAGAGLMFYHLYKLTGDRRYLDEGLRPIMDGVKKRFPPTTRLGNDDHSGVAAMGACLLYDDAELLQWLRDHIAAQLGAQDEDGSWPLLEGTQVAGISLLNFCQFAQEKGLSDDLAPCRAAIQKAVRFVPALQETDPRDVRAYGGVYGQASFGVSRELIHHRAACYSLIFMLREEDAVDVPAYNIFGW